MIITQAPFQFYTDRDGDALDQGYIYFGQPNLNPENAPVPVFWDLAGTIPAGQPIRTMNGYPVRNGTPANVYTQGMYSVTVKDKKRRIVYYAPTSIDFTNGVTPEEFGAVGDGVTDDTAAFNAAAVRAKSEGVALTMGEGVRYFINGVFDFDCSLDGGVFLIGASGSMSMKVTTVGSYRSVKSSFENVSGNDLKQALIVGSNDLTRKGHIRIDVRLKDFLNGVYGQVCETFELVDTCYAYSRNLVAGRTAESHFACHTTNVYIARGYSDGSVLGFSSGANVIREFYESPVAINSFDHGIYSSSPTGKLVTVFNACQSVDAGGTGLKCFSNGDLFINAPIVKNAGKIGIIAVADNAYITGGVVDNPTQAAVYQIGKDVGAGVNTFNSLVVKGLTVRNGQDDGIRVSGPDTLTTIQVIDCDIECAKNPVNLIAAPTVTARVDILNSRLKSSTLTNDQIIFDSISPTVMNLRNVLLEAGTTTANMIDTQAGTVNMNLVEFRAVSALRYMRARKVGAVVNEVRTTGSGTYTGTPLITLDSGTFNFEFSTGSKTFDWPALITGAQQSTTVTVAGAALGDYVEDVSMSVSLGGTHIWGEVTSANTVTVYQGNSTGGPVDVVSGTLRARVRRAA